jgi:hypothetical protein
MFAATFMGVKGLGHEMDWSFVDHTQIDLSLIRVAAAF